MDVFDFPRANTNYFGNSNYMPVMFMFSGSAGAKLSSQVNRKLIQIKEAGGDIVEIRYGPSSISAQDVSVQQQVVIIFAAVTSAMAEGLVDDQSAEIAE